MTEDDLRHGSVAGYNAHRRSGLAYCDACRRAKMRYEKARTLVGGVLKVPAIGTRRRIQALRALGYSLAELAEMGGWRTEHAAFKYPMTAETITAATAARVADLYEQLCMAPASGPRANRLRIIARRNGWAPPLAWDDIDTDDSPDIARTTIRKHDVDEVLVARAVAGGDRDIYRKATVAERRQIVRAWRQAGRPLNELARISGWKPERYHEDAA